MLACCWAHAGGLWSCLASVVYFFPCFFGSVWFGSCVRSCVEPVVWSCGVLVDAAAGRRGVRSAVPSLSLFFASPLPLPPSVAVPTPVAVSVAPSVVSLSYLCRCPYPLYCRLSPLASLARSSHAPLFPAPCLCTVPDSDAFFRSLLLSPPLSHPFLSPPRRAPRMSSSELSQVRASKQYMHVRRRECRMLPC